jgi:hypothetical protein
VTRLLQRWQQVSGCLQDKWGHLLYNYFNWRQDNTAKDLLLIFTLFFSFVMLGSCTNRWVIDDAAERGTGGLWNDVYQASTACRVGALGAAEVLQAAAEIHHNAVEQQSLLVCLQHNACRTTLSRTCAVAGLTVANKRMNALLLCHVLLQVCQWVFGQEFPGPESPVGQQAFAVVTAMVGLCAFALVLALVEQVVLEGMEANVKRGSRVYEAAHVSGTMRSASSSNRRCMMYMSHSVHVRLWQDVVVHMLHDADLPGRTQ